jgi:uncharacterized protein YqhQ
MSEKFQYGGQAVLEGIMMRGPKDAAVAVRKKSGEIKLEHHKLSSITEKHPWLKWPMLRGVIALYESMVVGMKMITFSANVLAEEEGEEEEVLTNKEIALSMIFALGLATLLFVVIPAGTAYLVRDHLTPFWQNLVEGIVRIGIFILYVLAIGKIEDIKRVFMYHGAEHKVIHAYEAQEDLTVENVKKYSTSHPRCGTSFILIVLLLSIIIYSFLHVPGILYRLTSRIVLLPVIAGLGYEFIKWSGKNCNNSVVKFLIAPGMWLQKLTTKEPDGEQIEVAIVALKAVLDIEDAKDQETVGQEEKLVEAFEEVSCTVENNQEKNDLINPPL